MNGQDFNYDHWIGMDFAAKIKQGRKKQLAGGGESPDGSRWDFFVMDDVYEKFPEVEGVYGKDPKVIHGFICGTEMKTALPVQWAKYGDSQKGRKSGKKSKGKKQCFSSGPDMATGLPGVARWLERRDKVTKKVPTRDCHGFQCEDYGACKLRTMIPLNCPQLHRHKPMLLTSTSVKVLGRLVTFISKLIERYGENSVLIPIKLYRMETLVGEESREMQLIGIDYCSPGEYEKLFPQAWAFVNSLNQQQLAAKMERDKLAIAGGVEKYVEDESNNTVVVDDKDLDGHVIDVGKSDYEIQVAEAMKDPDVDEQWKEFMKALGKKSSTPRQKETWIRKCGEHEFLTAVVISRLKDRIIVEKAKKKEVTESSQ